VMQVCDRIHRIGQKSPNVNIYFLFADGTIENEIANNLETSMLSMNKILDGKHDSNLICSFDDMIIKGMKNEKD